MNENLLEIKYVVDGFLEDQDSPAALRSQIYFLVKIDLSKSLSTKSISSSISLFQDENLISTEKLNASDCSLIKSQVGKIKFSFDYEHGTCWEKFPQESYLLIITKGSSRLEFGWIDGRNFLNDPSLLANLNELVNQILRLNPNGFGNLRSSLVENL